MSSRSSLTSGLTSHPLWLEDARKAGFYSWVCLPCGFRHADRASLGESLIPGTGILSLLVKRNVWTRSMVKGDPAAPLTSILTAFNTALVLKRAVGAYLPGPIPLPLVLYLPSSRCRSTTQSWTCCFPQKLSLHALLSHPSLGFYIS